MDHMLKGVGGEEPIVKDNVEGGETITIDRSNQPKTMDLLTSGKKGDIEQALYNMRIQASKGSGESMSDWVGNKKYAKDVDLIMKHGLENVIIESGRVTLKGSANNIISTNGVSSKVNGVSSSASYEETGGETIVVKSGSGGDDTVGTETQGSAEAILVGTGGGGDDDEIGDLLYKGG